MSEISENSSHIHIQKGEYKAKMNRAAQLRSSIEGSLARRIPAALTPQIKIAPPVISTGITELDAVLCGGLPVGAITEIVGAVSSGRTTCAQAFVARVLAEGQVGAWVDVSESFDPESAAANGIDLSRLLWVRCSGSGGQPGSSEGLRPGRPVSTTAPPAASPVMGGGGSPHPRSEVRGLPEALDTLFSGAAVHGTPDAYARSFTPPRRARNIGTPGMPNRDLYGSEAAPRAVNREEQVATDRLPARRGAYLLAQRTRTSVAAIPAKRSELVAERRSLQTAFAARSFLRVVEGPTGTPARFQAPNRRPWSRLDQALRAMDLVLQAGGFSTVVFDLSDVAPEFVSRIPLATWFRFRAAAERTRAAILLLTQHPCAQSSAEVVLRTHLAAPEPGTVLSALPCTVEVVRQRFRPSETKSNVLPLRKSPQRVNAAGWTARVMWAGGC